MLLLSLLLVFTLPISGYAQETQAAPTGAEALTTQTVPGDTDTPNAEQATSGDTTVTATTPSDEAGSSSDATQTDLAESPADTDTTQTVPQDAQTPDNTTTSADQTAGTTDTSTTLDEVPSAADLTAIAALTTMPAEGANFDGYIVKIKAKNVDNELIADAPTDPVAKQFFRVDVPEDVLNFASPADIEYIEPNYVFSMLGFPADGSPNDPAYVNGTQWNLDGTYGIHPAAAWVQGLDGSGETIAVLDTGVNGAHTDFTATNILTGYDYTNGDGTLKDTNTGDNVGHGTMVTSIIAASTNNANSIAGIAYGASILPVKVMDMDPATHQASGTVIDMVAGLYAISQYDTAHPGSVAAVNMSLGITGADLGITSSDPDPTSLQAMQQMMTMLRNQGIILVAAAGNEGTSTLYYPAACDGVVGVGAINSDGTIASISERNSSVDVVAPGTNITGLSYNSTTNTASGSGTSYAAPEVSALAALARQKNPSLTPAGFDSLLATTAVDMGTPGRDDTFGYGRVDMNTVFPADAIGDTLQKGDILHAGDYRISADGRYTLNMQSDGNLVIYGPYGAVWQAKTSGNAGAYAIFQSDGNLVIYKNGKALWNSQTYNKGYTQFVMENTGNLIGYSTPSHQLTWASGNELSMRKRLDAGDALRSVNGRYSLAMQADGNLALSGPYGVIWQTNTSGNPGAYAIFQSDGNFVIYLNGKALWNSGTSGKGVTRVDLENAGNLVAYAGSNLRWATGNELSLRKRLDAGDAMRSADGRYRLVMQTDGNLVLYGVYGAIWQTKTNGNAGAYAIFQSDGNLVVYKNGKALWNSGTYGESITRFVLENSGNLIAYNGSAFVWVNQNIMATNRRLDGGDIIYSPDGKYRLCMQGDGNLVFYATFGAIWSSGTSGKSGDYAILQADGNFVVYYQGKAVWNSGTSNKGVAKIAVLSNGSVVALQSNGSVVKTIASLPVLRGIDVSYWNGGGDNPNTPAINWAVVAQSGIQFAMVRAGWIDQYGVFNIDSTYVSNAKNARARGILIGAYIYEYCSDYNTQSNGISAFVNYTRSQGVILDLPAVLDVEDPIYQAGTDVNGGYAYRTNLIRSGLQQLRASGFKPGFYTSLNWAQTMFNAVQLENEGTTFWLARWYNNNAELDRYMVTWNGGYPGIWQYRSTGSVSGIVGSVDMDYLYPFKIAG